MVLVGIPVLVLVGLAIIYTLFTTLIVGPWIDEQFGNHQTPWWKKVALWPLHKIADLTKNLVHRLTAHFARIFINNEPAVARFIRRQSASVELLTGVIADTNQAVYESFVYIRHTLVPTLIERAIAPVRATANTALREERAITVKLNDARGYVNTMLRALPWGAGATFELALRQFAGAFEHLWTKVYVNLENRVEALERTLKRVGDEVTILYDDLYRRGMDGLDGIRARLAELEATLKPILTNPTTWIFGLLGAAMVPALTAGGMRTAFGNLTCRNTQTVAKTICAADEAALAQLLAMFLGFGILMDPKLVLRAGQEVESAIDGVFRTMSGV